MYRVLGVARSCYSCAGSSLKRAGRSLYGACSPWQQHERCSVPLRHSGAGQAQELNEAQLASLTCLTDSEVESVTKEVEAVKQQTEQERTRHQQVRFPQTPQTRGSVTTSPTFRLRLLVQAMCVARSEQAHGTGSCGLRNPCCSQFSGLFRLSKPYCHHNPGLLGSCLQ